MFFLRNLHFQQVLQTSVFLNSKCLKISTTKKIHIPLFVNQFISLIELKIQRLINYGTNTCKFKIDKITYSKWLSRTMDDVSKNKQMWEVYYILKVMFMGYTLQKNLSFRYFLFEIWSLTTSKKYCTKINTPQERNDEKEINILTCFICWYWRNFF